MFYLIAFQYLVCFCLFVWGGGFRSGEESNGILLKIVGRRLLSVLQDLLGSH